MPSRHFSSTATFLVAVALLSSACRSDTIAPIDPPQVDTLPAPPPPPPPPPSSTLTPALSRSVVVSGLGGPWDLAFAADGTLFFTERCAGLSVRRPDGGRTRLFGSGGAQLVAPDLFCTGQSGMLGVALDPAFATNRRVYVYMASNLSGAPRTNRVVQLELNSTFTSVSNRQDIVTDLAFKHVGNAHGGDGAHSGGRIRFGPDGLLYIGTGDNHDGALPQSPTRMGGKVLRVTTTGMAAAGNNPPTGFDPRVFSYGHRNVQGISFRPGTGQPFVAEHGPNHSDEVTALVAGGNAGWDPQNRPALTCPDGYCGYAGNPTTMPMTDLVRFPSALRASWTNNNVSQGMGPAAFLDGEQWLAWNGRLAVGIMGARRLEILALDSGGTTTGTVTADLPSTRYRALTQGPDGALYIATDSGEIWRVVPSAP